MLKDRMNFHKKDFTKQESKIYNWILNNEANKIPNNIIEASKVFEVSTSAITRFCQKIKISGWNEMLFIIKKEKDESKKRVGNPLLNDLIYSLSRTENSLNLDAIKIIAKNIIKSSYVCLYGESFTELAATKFSRKLNKIGISTTTFNVASDLAIIMPKDDSIHIFISMSGMNPNIKRAVKKIKNNKDKQQLIYGIGSTKYSNIEDEINEYIGGEFYQQSSTDPYELPSVAGFVVNYILEQIFEHIYKINKEKYTDIINGIAKEKRR